MVGGKKLISKFYEKLNPIQCNKWLSPYLCTKVSDFFEWKRRVTKFLS